MGTSVPYSGLSVVASCASVSTPWALQAFRQQLAQRRVARELEAHVADEVRQLVAGVQALEVRRAVDVVVGVDEPVRVEHHDRVHPRSAATPVNLDR
jgi:hypothetical protein